MHWSVMTITSIGYGDIVPMRYEEYLACATCQIIAGIVWAYVIGSVCSILSNGIEIEEAFEASTDLLNDVMKNANVPKRIGQVFLKYLREAKKHKASCQFRGLAKGFSPQLKGYLMIHMSERWITNMSYFKNAPHECIMEAVQAFQSLFFAQRETLTSVLHCLGIVQKDMLFYGLNMKTNGFVFQTDMIVANLAPHGVRRIICLTYCQILGSKLSCQQECRQEYNWHGGLTVLVAFVVYMRLLQIAMSDRLERPWVKTLPLVRLLWASEMLFVALDQSLSWVIRNRSQSFMMSQYRYC